MELDILSAECVRVVIGAEECRRFGISYDSFSADSTGARLFMAAVVARLEVMGAELDRTKKLTAEIFPKEGGGLVIYLSGKGMKCVPPERAEVCFAGVYKTPSELISAAAALGEETSAELYRFGKGYALIADRPPAGSSSKHESSVILAAKIKEYGEFLSDTPYELLKDL